MNSRRKKMHGFSRNLVVLSFVDHRLMKDLKLDLQLFPHENNNARFVQDCFQNCSPSSVFLSYGQQGFSYRSGEYIFTEREKITKPHWCGLLMVTPQVRNKTRALLISLSQFRSNNHFVHLTVSLVILQFSVSPRKKRHTQSFIRISLFCDGEKKHRRPKNGLKIIDLPRKCAKTIRMN